MNCWERELENIQCLFYMHNVCQEMVVVVVVMVVVMVVFEASVLSVGRCRSEWMVGCRNFFWY